MQENSSTNTHENGGVKALMHFYKTIENNEVEELKNILEQEQLAKQTLNVGLTRAITNYRNNSDSIDIIDSLLSNNADPNLFIQHKNSNQQAASSEKITILMFACLKGDLQLIHTILKHNPNVNLKDSFQRNALFYAITADKGDNADIVLTLINSGINVNQTEKESKDGPPLAGHSPLTLASQKNLRNTVKALLDNGADPDWTVLKDGNTAMHYAVRNSNIHIIEKLLSKNANPMAINKDNLTPLSLALKLSHTDIYKSLVEVHNKIAQREDESAQTLMTENKVNNNSSSKKKKKPKEADTFSYEKPVSLEEKDFNDEDKAEKEIAQPNKQEINKDNTLNTNNKDNSLNNNTFITNHTSSTPSQKKKNPKLELLSQLKELKLTNLKHQNSKSNNETGSSQNIKKDPLSLLEVPFQINKKINDSIQRKVESYLKISATPTLILDLSSKAKEDSAVLSFQVEELTNILAEKTKEIKLLQDNVKYLNEENFRLAQDNQNLSELLSNKERTMVNMNSDWIKKEEQLLTKIADMQTKLENVILANSDMVKSCEKYELEITELNQRNLSKENIRVTEQPISRKDLLMKKFINTKYDDSYIIKCLQKDILDFQEYTKDQIKKNKKTVDELLRFVQNAVNECIPDYEVKLYGSHATGLCLNWSDLDIVLVNKRSQYSNNYNPLQALFINLYEKPWKKTIKFIESAVIPIIKITSTEEYNSMQMDISLQDAKHYGLKCVELVKSFMGEYEALEPLIFALKNLLKNANLNDPYIGGLSSYGLILMVVSYLQSQIEGKKPIHVGEGNIGRLFLEFLCYYGLIFDHTKYVIYTYPTSDLGYIDKEGNNIFMNMQTGHELIIVDPLNKANNVARSSYQFLNIKMAFMIGFVVSREDCECGCHFNKMSEDYLLLNTDHCILKRIFNSVKRFNTNGNSQ